MRGFRLGPDAQATISHHDPHPRRISSHLDFQRAWIRCSRIGVKNDVRRRLRNHGHQVRDNRVLQAVGLCPLSNSRARQRNVLRHSRKVEAERILGMASTCQLLFTPRCVVTGTVSWYPRT